MLLCPLNCSRVQTGLLLAGSAELAGRGVGGLQNLGAEEFYAWMAVNSNYGAGRVMG